MGSVTDFPGVLVGARASYGAVKSDYLAVETYYLPEKSDIAELVKDPAVRSDTLEGLAKGITNTKGFKRGAEPGHIFSLINFPYRLAQFNGQATVELRPLTKTEMRDLTKRCEEAIDKIRKPHGSGAG